MNLDIYQNYTELVSESPQQLSGSIIYQKDSQAQDDKKLCVWNPFTPCPLVGSNLYPFLVIRIAIILRGVSEFCESIQRTIEPEGGSGNSPNLQLVSEVLSQKTVPLALSLPQTRCQVKADEVQTRSAVQFMVLQKCQFPGFDNCAMVM